MARWQGWKLTSLEEANNRTLELGGGFLRGFFGGFLSVVVWLIFHWVPLVRSKDTLFFGSFVTRGWWNTGVRAWATFTCSFAPWVAAQSDNKGKEIVFPLVFSSSFFSWSDCGRFSNAFLRGMCCLSEITGLINNEADTHSLLHLSHRRQQPVTGDAVFNPFCSNSSWTSRFDRELVVVTSMSYLLILPASVCLYCRKAYNSHGSLITSTVARKS